MSANPQPRPLEPGDLDLMISRSLDGDLPDEEERELRILLAADAAARARYEAMAGLVGRLEEIPDPETPFALATRVNGQVEADTKGLAATLHRFGFYFRPATIGVVVAGIVAVAIAYTVVTPQKPSATVAAKARPAPADDGRVTVYLGPADKAKAEAKDSAAAPAGGAPASDAGRAEARPARPAEAEPVLVASAETAREKKEQAWTPEADASVAPSAPAPAALEESVARDAVAQKGAVAEEGARFRVAAPAAVGAARAVTGVEIVGRSAGALRLASPARLDGLTGPFEGNYRLELDASGRVTDVVRLFGGSGSEPAALQVRLRALSFGPAVEAAAAQSVDVRVRIP